MYRNEKASDASALKFSGYIRVDQLGDIRFMSLGRWLSSLFNDSLLINNDRLQGPTEQAGEIDLAAGSHKLVVTYFDNGGGDVYDSNGQALVLTNRRSHDRPRHSGETIHDFAINSLAAIPGHEAEKFDALITILKGRQRTSSISSEPHSCRRLATRTTTTIG